ncbi:hypothetical protein [Robbsia sp. KACC 23696]|uniref:hypothetical protein n=1 Tax=Robbsia sp. KACC 23696 TaxID=3149231 RepID=UPI00325C1DD6
MGRPYIQRRTPPKGMSSFEAISRVRALSTQLDQAEVDELDAPALAAVEMIAQGMGTREHWDVMSRAINQAWTLACNDIGSQAKPTIQAASYALGVMSKRYERTGRLIFDGNTLRLVRETLAVRADQLRLATVGEVMEASRMVERYYDEVRI